MVKLISAYIGKKSKSVDPINDVIDVAKRLDRVIGNLTRCASCQVAVDQLKCIHSTLDKFVSRSLKRPLAG